MQNDNLIRQFKKAVYIEAKKKMMKTFENRVSLTIHGRKILDDIKNGNFVATDGVTETMQCLYVCLKVPTAASDILPQFPANYKVGVRRRAGDSIIIKSSVEYRNEVAERANNLQRLEEEKQQRIRGRQLAAESKQKAIDERKRQGTIRKAATAAKKKIALEKKIINAEKRKLLSEAKALNKNSSIPKKRGRKAKVLESTENELAQSSLISEQEDELVDLDGIFENSSK